ncbi:MAG TPA: hypothetical protein VGD60_02355 [Candidatus Acidoferrales bacterium]
MMKRFGAIGTLAMFCFLGATVGTFAQEEHHEEAAKPAEHQEAAKPPQEESKPAARPEEGKPVDRSEEAKRQQQQQVKTKQTEEKTVTHQQQVSTRTQETNSRWAKSGTKDRAGHVYEESRFGPSHATHFVENGGRLYSGRREYSYGGYWFYASSYPPWFYQQQVYFVLGADGLWYAVAVNDPSLTFAVEIE